MLAWAVFCNEARRRAVLARLRAGSIPAAPELIFFKNHPSQRAIKGDNPAANGQSWLNGVSDIQVFSPYDSHDSKNLADAS